MRIAYLSSVFPVTSTTFVTSEIDEHARCGHFVRPLSCDAPPADQPLSASDQRWRAQTAFPAGRRERLLALARESAAAPTAMARCIAWLRGLRSIDPVEYAIGLRELTTAACLAPVVRRDRIEHIHVHFASRSLTAGLLLGMLTDTPVSVTAHAHDLWSRSGENLAYRLGKCAFVATISDYNVRYITEHCGADIGALCRVVHCGIDLDRFTMRDPTRVEPGTIVSVARLSKQKGLQWLVLACAELRRRGVEFRCTILGSGPEEARLRGLVAAFGLEDVIELAGAVPNDEVQRHLETSQVFVLPCVVGSNGLQDGIPVALMEAMAMGVPVVSTRVSGIPELLGEGAGALVDPENAVALARAIAGILSDQTVADGYAEVGRRTIEAGFRIDDNAADLRAAFAETLGEGSRP